MSEALITIRVPRRMKEEMRRAKINWSRELREVIETRLESDGRRRAEKRLERLLSEVEPGFDTLSAIKEARKNG